MIQKIFYFIYQWVIIVPIMLVITIITAVTVTLGCSLGKGEFWGYYPPRLWSRIVCALCLLPVKVKGYENIDSKRSYIYVANHQGAFDIFLIYGYLNRPFKWIMKQSLQKMPFVGKACAAAGHIFIDDSGARGIKTSFTKALTTLEQGKSIVIFPEGSRTLDGKMHRFKKGAFQMAVDLNLPIIPITIEGPFKILKRGTVTLSPHRLSMTIHPAIEVDNQQPGEMARVQQLAYDTIKSSLTEE